MAFRGKTWHVHVFRCFQAETGSRNGSERVSPWHVPVWMWTVCLFKKKKKKLARQYSYNCVSWGFCVLLALLGPCVTSFLRSTLYSNCTCAQDWQSGIISTQMITLNISFVFHLQRKLWKDVQVGRERIMYQTVGVSICWLLNQWPPNAHTSHKYCECEFLKCKQQQNDDKILLLTRALWQWLRCRK